MPAPGPFIGKKRASFVVIMANLDGQKLGFGITVFAMVSLKSQAESALREFEAAMRDLPKCARSIC